MHLLTDNVISYETFLAYQSRKRTRELIDAAARDIREARQALQDKLLNAGWPADLMPYVNPEPITVTGTTANGATEVTTTANVMAAWWVNNNGVVT